MWIPNLWARPLKSRALSIAAPESLRQTGSMTSSRSLILLLLALGFLFPADRIFAAQALDTSSPGLNYKTPSKGRMVSQAVAQVGNHVITSREVIVSHIIDQALLLSPAKNTTVLTHKDWILKEDSEAFQKTLAQILLELVVQAEAENFSVGQVTAEEMTSHEKHLDEQVKAWQDWKNLEVTSGEVQNALARKIRAKNFLKFKTESSSVQISDEEAKTFYEKNRVKFGNLPFVQFKVSIKEVLAQEQLQDKLKDWFDILKRKYRVKYLGKATSN